VIVEDLPSLAWGVDLQTMIWHKDVPAFLASASR
jgi:hypothetical protein